MERLSMHHMSEQQIARSMLGLDATPAAMIALLERIIEFLPDAMLVVDRDHRVIAWNRAMEGMTGVAKQDILGRGDFAYALPFYGEQRPMLLDFIGKDPSPHYPLYQGETNQEGTLATEIHTPALYKGQGAVVWAKACQLTNRQGEIIGAIQSVRDVTERKRTENITGLLYLVSRTANTSIPNEELFTKVFDLLTWRLNLWVFSIFCDSPHVQPATFLHQGIDSPSVLPQLPELSATVLRTLAPYLATEPIEFQDGAQQAVWFVTPLKCGYHTMGTVTFVLPENNMRFLKQDAHILTTVTDHLALAVSRNIAEMALRESDEKHRSIFKNSTEGLFQISLDHDLLRGNPALARAVGYACTEDLMLQSTKFMRHLLPPCAFDSLFNQVRDQGRVDEFETRAVKADGSTTWVSINIRTAYTPAGVPSHFEGSLRDISDRKAAEHKLEAQKSLFQQLFDNSPEGMLLLGRDGAPQAINPSFTKMFGFTADDLDSLLATLLPANDLQESFSLISSVLRGTAINVEAQRLTKDGRSIPVAIVGYPYVLEEKIAGACFIFRDISDRKHFERQLTRQALHDNLTDLPNRTLFMDRLTQAMSRQERNSQYRFAVLMIDLDGFKRVNDSLGHQAGDILLREISKRLTQSLRSMDTVARMGGDEFAVLLEDFHANKQAISIVRRLLDDVRQPLQVQNRELLISASAGVVLHTSHYTSPDELLRDADISMYRSKERGKNQFKVFNKSMYEQVVLSAFLEDDLRQALNNAEFELYFQPIFALYTDLLQGFEALIRWNHPERGMISPAMFIPMAEKIGLISEISMWVIHRGFQALANWNKNHPSMNLVLALNLSPKDLFHPSLVNLLTDLLKMQNVEPRQIRLEITETAVMDNPEQAVTKLERLQKIGFQIAMDDFGTGYSSLSYLQRLPIDILKIDRSFVQTMHENPNNLEIIKAIVGLGKILNLRIVAEGVENAMQYRDLIELGCDMAQGFFLGKPMPLAQAEDLLCQQEEKTLRRQIERQALAARHG